MVALQRVWAAAAALLLAAAVTPAAGFLPPAAVGRRSALVLSRPACARPQVLSQQRRRSAGVRGMWAGGEEEPDMDAFREMLSDSWATDTAKQAYDDGEFDGYKFRDLIVEQWGAAYDIQIKREMFLGKPMLYLNVMWKYLGQQSFYLSEQEYLEHLQALAELLIKWDRVDHLKEEIKKQRIRPRANEGYAVPLPLNLPGELMDEINIPESQ